MDSLQRAWYALRFELEFRTKRGSEFQDWFVKVAGLAYGSDFDPIRNYGAMGDFKCDGRRLSTGTVFQCYAPGEIKEAETIAKINSDLPGAVQHWSDFISAWCFVHNDARACHRRWHSTSTRCRRSIQRSRSSVGERRRCGIWCFRSPMNRCPTCLAMRLR